MSNSLSNQTQRARRIVHFGETPSFPCWLFLQMPGLSPQWCRHEAQPVAWPGYWTHHHPDQSNEPEENPETLPSRATPPDQSPAAPRQEPTQEGEADRYYRLLELWGVLYNTPPLLTGQEWEDAFEEIFAETCKVLTQPRHAPPPAAPVEAQPKSPGNNDDNNGASACFPNATPRPWTFEPHPADRTIHIYGPLPEQRFIAELSPSTRFAQMEVDDNAALIIAAVNQFAQPRRVEAQGGELREALKACIGTLESNKAAFENAGNSLGALVCENRIESIKTSLSK